MSVELSNKGICEDADPLCREFIGQVIGSFYRDINKLVAKYRLLPNTVCLFDACFRHYLALKTKALPREWFKAGSQSSPLHPEVIRLAENFKIDALLCLRVAMKHEDHQVNMYRDFVVKEVRDNA